MRYIVFSLILMFSNLHASEKRFSSKECLSANFATEIEHNAYLFGLVKAKLKIAKKDCILNVSYKEVLEKKWTIDLCREPIHIKYHDKGSLNVYKKIKACVDDSIDDFCVYTKGLLTMIQDNGLIFASGAREKLDHNHGQVYCSYLLLKKYLVKGTIFSRFTEPADIYTEQTESCALPVKAPQVEVPVFSAPVVSPEVAPVDQADEVITPSEPDKPQF